MAKKIPTSIDLKKKLVRTLMRLVQPELIFLVGSAFCSIEDPSKANTDKLIEEDKKSVISVQENVASASAHRSSTDSDDHDASFQVFKDPECNNANENSLLLKETGADIVGKDASSKNTEGENDTETLCAICKKCLHEDEKRWDMLCPSCNRDSKCIVYQALLNYRGNEAAETLRAKMLECMAMASPKDLELFFDSMGFTCYECNSIASSLTDHWYSLIKDMAKSYATIELNEHADIYEFLISEDINYIPPKIYETLVIRYICSDSPLQSLNVLRRLLKRKYPSEEERRANARKFVEAFVSTTRDVKLFRNDAYELLHLLLENMMADSAKFILENTDIVYKMSIPQATDITIQCIDTGSDDGLAVLEYVWVHNIFTRYLKTGEEVAELKQVKQRMDEHLSLQNEANSDAVKNKVCNMDLLVPEIPPRIGISKAKKLAKRMAKDAQSYLSPAQTLKKMASEGILNALKRARSNKRMEFFKKSFDRQNGHIFKSVYLELPESAVSAKADLCFFERYVRQSSSTHERIMRCIRFLVRRKYFKYKMFSKMLKVLIEAKAIGVITDESLCTWLLAAVKNRSLLKFLKKDVWEGIALYERISDAKLFGTRALVSKVSNNEARNIALDAILISETKGLFVRLPMVVQADLIYNYTNTDVFTALGSQFASLMEQLLRKRLAMDAGLFVMYVCWSDYYRENISNTEVDKLVEMLLNNGNAGLKYIELFLRCTRSKQHMRAAKKRLFEFIFTPNMTDEEIAAMGELRADYASACSKINKSDLENSSTAEAFARITRDCLLKLARYKMNKPCV